MHFGQCNNKKGYFTSPRQGGAPTHDTWHESWLFITLGLVANILTFFLIICSIQWAAQKKKKNLVGHPLFYDKQNQSTIITIYIRFVTCLLRFIILILAWDPLESKPWVGQWVANQDHGSCFGLELLWFILMELHFLVKKKKNGVDALTRGLWY